MKAYGLIIWTILLLLSCKKDSPEYLLEQKISGKYNFYDLNFILGNYYVDTITQYNLYSKSGNEFYVRASLEKENKIYFNFGEETILIGENLKYIDSLNIFAFNIPNQTFNFSENVVHEIKGYKCPVVTCREHFFEGTYSEGYCSSTSNEILNRCSFIKFAFEIIDPESDKKYIGRIRAFRE